MSNNYIYSSTKQKTELIFLRIEQCFYTHFSICAAEESDDAKCVATALRVERGEGCASELTELGSGNEGSVRELVEKSKTIFSLASATAASKSKQRLQVCSSHNFIIFLILPKDTNSSDCASVDSTASINFLSPSNILPLRVLACRAKEELSARVVGNNRFRERIRVVSITALCFISTTFRPASKSSKDILMQIKKTNLTF